eukprot:1354764-Amorphochlora_amoeboformis.AAC.1
MCRRSGIRSGDLGVAMGSGKSVSSMAALGGGRGIGGRISREWGGGMPRRSRWSRGGLFERKRSRTSTLFTGRRTTIGDSDLTGRLGRCHPLSALSTASLSLLSLSVSSL